MKQLAVALLLIATPASAEIYKYLDPKGQLHVTDKKLEEPYRLISVVRFGSQQSSSYVPNNVAENTRLYLPHIKSAARKYRIDPALLHAIVDTESSFNPQARSKAGALGLMQLMPETAQRLGVKNSLDPEENIQAGAFYFRQLLDKFNQNIRLSLAAYNAGEGAVRRAGAIPEFPETQRYVKKVLQKYNELK